MVKWWSAKFSFWSGQHLGQTSVKFGQPWSNLVKVGQTSPNSGKCVPGLRPEVLSVWWVPVGSDRLGQTSVKLGQTSVKLGQPWSNLVNLGQAWSDSGKCAPDPVLRLFDVASPRRIRPTWFGLPHFACRHPRKSRG
uniref:Uncharacterized protein n=1 Tax=Fagus sylvatica TaxID=28930 RepID=A0A2N9HD25_FAGSY